MENKQNNKASTATTSNTNTSTKKSGSYSNKGKKTTPKGYMPPSMLKRFGLKENSPNLEVNGEQTDKRFTIEQNRWIKRMTQQVVTYRMMTGQCKTESRLPAPLRNVIKYFSYPIVGGGGAPTMAQVGPEEGADPTKTTLKV